MTNIEFLRLTQAQLHEDAEELARQNGASRDRPLDELRYGAGVVHGMLMAGAMMEEILRTAGNE